MKRHRRTSTGFTLLELLVAIAIFAIIGALALGGLNAVLSQEGTASRQLDRVRDVQYAMRLLTDDFAQFARRPVRDGLGTTEPPLIAPCGVEHLVCLSRDGWRNPFGVLDRGELQRVQYRVEDGTLVRAYWAVMDRTLVNEPREQRLLGEVETFRVEFLDRTTNEWREVWEAESGMPVAARVTIMLKDWGELVRIVEMLG